MYISTTLPYSKETLLSFVTDFNQSLWPTQVLFFLLACFALWGLNSPKEIYRKAASLILCFFWLHSGLHFYIFSFSEISFLANYIGIFYVLEAFIVLILLLRLLPNSPILLSSRKRLVGVFIVTIALFLYPATVFFLTLTPFAIPVVGITPLATSLYTLGLISLLQLDTRGMVVALTIPTLHILLSITFFGFLFN